MRKQIIRGYIAAAAAGIAVALFLSLLIMNILYRASLRERLKSVIILTASQIEPDTYGSENLQTALDRIEQQFQAEGQDIRLAILDSGGAVLADSDGDAAQSGDSRTDRPEIQAAMEGAWGFDSRDSQTSDRYFIYAARAVNGFIFRAALPADEYRSILYAMLLSSILCVMAGTFTAWVLGRWTAQKLVEPVQKLTGATLAIASGDFHQQVEEYPAELGELGRSFNLMSVRLQEATQTLQANNAELRSIIGGIQDGIIAIEGPDAKPFLLSERAMELLGPYKRSYDSLETYGANYTKISLLARRALDIKEPIQETLELSHPQETILSIYCAPFGPPELMGCVIVLHDVTRVTKLERIRSEFVANVTHELKTPLTSIRGYVQLLKSAERDRETQEQFYEIIEIETDRLMTLISDLLDLSEIENRGREQLEMGGVPFCLLSDVMDEVQEQMAPIAEERRVHIEVDVPWDLEVPAEYRRVRQLLTNLVSNAVIYNKPGGTVRVSGRVERDTVSIVVQDDGIGIPAEHQERIFERFYRVSKDRSRELGGTGLGLSIVKHIVNLYNGTITLKSEAGQGSVFHIRFPLPRGPLTREVIDDI